MPPTPKCPVFAEPRTIRRKHHLAAERAEVEHRRAARMPEIETGTIVCWWDHEVQVQIEGVAVFPSLIPTRWSFMEEALVNGLAKVKINASS